MSPNSKENATFMDKLRLWGVFLLLPGYITVISVIYIFVALIIRPFIRTSANWFLWLVFTIFSNIIGLKTELRDGHKLRTAPKGVIVMNHQTAWDIFMVISVYGQLGDTIHTVSRKEVFYLWPLGYAMHLSGSLFIDRKTPQAALESLISESKRIFALSNSLKSKVIIFPEGTRNPKVGGDLLQFKRGAFKVAMACNVPVIPIVCSPHTFFRSFKYFRPGKVFLRCLDPVIIDPNSDLDLQIESIRRDMQREYTNFKKEFGVTAEE